MINYLITHQKHTRCLRTGARVQSKMEAGKKEHTHAHIHTHSNTHTHTHTHTHTGDPILPGSLGRAETLSQGHSLRRTIQKRKSFRIKADTQTDSEEASLDGTLGPDDASHILYEQDVQPNGSNHKLRQSTWPKDIKSSSTFLVGPHAPSFPCFLVQHSCCTVH